MKRKWSEQEDAILRMKYADTPSDEIAAELGRSLCAIYNRAREFDLKKDENYRSEAGRMGSRHPKAVAMRFTKGHVPVNRGKKMSAETYRKVARTFFRKGNIPVNHRSVGSERVNRDGYAEIKVAEPNKWKLKHRLLWEREHGQIPKGFNIQFRNGNRQDVRIENLYLISRSEQMRKENCMEARYPETLRKVIRMRSALKRQITLVNRKRNEQQ